MEMKTPRARPLAPEDRRQSILNALIPLLIEKGAAVTTAEVARAAGIAEGTIFRVFPDKATLLHAAMESTLDPLPFQAALNGIDQDLSLEEQLAGAAKILADRFERVSALMGVLRSMPHEQKPHADTHRFAHDAMEAILAALTAVMARHEDRLSIEPAQAAVFLRGLIFTGTHPLLASAARVSSEQTVHTLLHGILRKEGIEC
jgi:AcrR family transcriptional regulator